MLWRYASGCKSDNTCFDLVHEEVLVFPEARAELFSIFSNLKISIAITKSISLMRQLRIIVFLVLKNMQTDGILFTEMLLCYFSFESNNFRQEVPLT